MKVLTSKFIVILYMLFVSISNSAQSDLQTLMDNHFEQYSYKHASLSVCVMDMETNKIVAAINPEISLIPASSLKLITTLSALDILGPEYTFTTKISYSGKIDPDGTLNGNIYIVGSGDPTLGSPRTSLEGEVLSFNKLIVDIGKSIRDHGITCIDGEVIADESIFESYPISPSWQWNDLGNYYASGAWGINANENEYYIYFKRNLRIGQSTILHSYKPYIPKLELLNEVTIDSSNTPDNAYVFGGPYDFKKRIVGTIPYGQGLYRIKGSIPDPPTFFAYHVYDQLKKYQISSRGYKSKYKAKKIEMQDIKSYESPSLDKIAKITNYHSVNIYAESLMKTIGSEKNNQGSDGNGLIVVQKNMQDLELKLTPLHMEDGSGLSARNIISSKFMCQFLDKMYDEIDHKLLLSTIPHPGSASTVRGLSAGSEAQYNIWVKSGSMERVQTFSGYIRSKKGKWLSFSIMANGLHVKNKNIRTLMAQMMRSIYEKA
tara:strand:- start:1269 stop:2735 length:1467 start_codon:yes stop_codon:yes gene_type:complete